MTNMPTGQDAMLFSMELLETIDQKIELATQIQGTPSIMATTAMWEQLRDEMPDLIGLLNLFRSGMTESAKLFSNDAVYGHIGTVLLAD